MRYEINTNRLSLRILGKESAPLVLDFYNRNKDIFEKYEPIMGEDFYTLDHQKRVLEFEHNNILKLIMLRYWIFERNNPRQIVGTVSFRNIVRPIYQSCTIGYKMDRDYMNRGYCSEAISATVPLIAKELGIHRFEALVLPDNAPSIHMLEKLGFQYEGTLRDKIIINGARLDHRMYAFLANN
ncbi:MAG: GNAT family N-acetyltransferase [Pseudobutyrivibrio sp.]|nr:GNAT family N-acetyltransferase [Pseudobutyrivibrio sp.]